MMNTIFTKVIYQKRWVLLAWFIGMIAMTTLTMVFYPTFKGGGLDLSNLPPALQKLVGDMASLKTVGGYINQEIFALRMPMMTIIMSIAIFYGLISGEERRGLLETQLSLPFSRNSLLAHKLSAGAALTLIASLGIIVGLWLGLVSIGEHYSTVSMLKDTLACWLLGLDYGLVAFALGAVLGARGLVLGLASGIAFISFLISSMAPAVSLLQSVDHISLFHYYQSGGTVHGRDMLILSAVAVVLISCGFFGFNRRDLTSQ